MNNFPDGVTMIEDITESPGVQGPKRHPAIRESTTRPEHYAQSGMLGTGVFEGYQPGGSSGYASMRPAQAHGYTESGMTEQFDGHDVYEKQPTFTPAQLYGGNCVDVADHTSNCPVCSKLYSQDNTAYYVVIVVLIIIVLLMFIKLMDR